MAPTHFRFYGDKAFGRTLEREALRQRDIARRLQKQGLVPDGVRRVALEGDGIPDGTEIHIYAGPAHMFEGLSDDLINIYVPPQEEKEEKEDEFVPSPRYEVRELFFFYDQKESKGFVWDPVQDEKVLNFSGNEDPEGEYQYLNGEQLRKILMDDPRVVAFSGNNAVEWGYNTEDYSLDQNTKVVVNEETGEEFHIVHPWPVPASFSFEQKFYADYRKGLCKDDPSVVYTYSLSGSEWVGLIWEIRTDQPLPDWLYKDLWVNFDGVLRVNTRYHQIHYAAVFPYDDIVFHGPKDKFIDRSKTAVVSFTLGQPRSVFSLSFNTRVREQYLHEGRLTFNDLENQTFGYQTVYSQTPWAEATPLNPLIDTVYSEFYIRHESSLLMDLGGSAPVEVGVSGSRLDEGVVLGGVRFEDNMDNDWYFVRTESRSVAYLDSLEIPCETTKVGTLYNFEYKLYDKKQSFHYNISMSDVGSSAPDIVDNTKPFGDCIATLDSRALAKVACGMSTYFILVQPAWSTDYSSKRYVPNANDNLNGLGNERPLQECPGLPSYIKTYLSNTENLEKEFSSHSQGELICLAGSAIGEDGAPVSSVRNNEALLQEIAKISGNRAFTNELEESFGENNLKDLHIGVFLFTPEGDITETNVYKAAIKEEEEDPELYIIFEDAKHPDLSTEEFWEIRGFCDTNTLF